MMSFGRSPLFLPVATSLPLRWSTVELAGTADLPSTAPAFLA